MESTGVSAGESPRDLRDGSRVESEFCEDAMVTVLLLGSELFEEFIAWKLVIEKMDNPIS